MEELVTTIKGVGSASQGMLKKLGIITVSDLIQYIPRTYQDFSDVNKVSQLEPGLVTVKVDLSNVKGRYVRRGMHITEATATDDSGSLKITWFNQPYREASIKRGEKYYVAGDFGLNYGRLSIINPHTELVSGFPINAARIVPVYRETKGVTSKQLRKYIKEVVPKMDLMPEVFPEWLVSRYGLPTMGYAYKNIHFPATSDDLSSAKRRLAFNEVFELILSSLLIKQEVATEVAQKITFNDTVAQQFVSALPFKLTNGQKSVAWKILQDISSDKPMNRLIEGDVGSGKTVVAAMATVMASANDMQTAFMAPTELLARQHANVLYNLLKPMGLAENVVLLVGGMSAKEKKRAYEAISKGIAKVVVGTHALIQDSVDMHNLALIIIDEQHRFGVKQRKKLLKKSAKMPHVLSLTATPIPRSLALTLYGELDISILVEKPALRKDVITKIASPNSRDALYESISKELNDGRQMFVVCPLITDDSKIAASGFTASSATKRSVEKVGAEMKKQFENFNVGILHGKMSPDEKNAIMQDFINKKINILVSTTVIEVGVDAPNATVMLIESADRFGLAQLHQLRGRVGRGKDQGYCYLIMSDSSSPSKRIRALESSNDGFKLAELDLELRGPGAIYGVMQHGSLDLRIAQLSDHRLIAEAREAAEEFINRGENLLHYSQLHKQISHLQKVTNLN